MTNPSGAVIVHLSGDLNGSTSRLAGERIRVGSSGEAELQLPPGRSQSLGDVHVILYAMEGSYRLAANPPHRVWVNSQLIEERRLDSGDLIELGEDGPLLRFRLYPPGEGAFKSIREALADCYQSAKRATDSAVGRTWLFATGVIRQLATQVSPWARTLALAASLLMLASITYLGLESRRLESRLEVESRQVDGLQDLLDDTGSSRTSATELEALRRELEARIASTTERVDYLEERAGAVQRTIAEAARSVVFLQGSYGFREAASGEALRFALTASGSPAMDAQGNPRFTTQGDGPLVEAMFTGTGFFVSPEGLILTNRHLALPWEFDADARQVIAQGLEPFMLRFIGYPPRRAEPFDVELLAASDQADLAVLLCKVDGPVRSLPLDRGPPRLGEPVIVLGFPTGIQAMMARADQDFLESVADERLDFWEIAARLAGAEQIGPLATQGIIGQVSESSIVYDAVTTSGGSGGPVLDLDGRVVAINSAILREFDGSNLGVPATLGLDLMSHMPEGSEPTGAPAEPEPESTDPGGR